MNVSLKPDVQKLIDERVNSGKYSSPEDVVEAAVRALDQLENFGDFEAGELDRLLAEGSDPADTMCFVWCVLGKEEALAKRL